MTKTDPTIEADIPVQTAVVVSDPEPVKPAAGMQVVEVIAPADMAAGYQFNVDAGGGQNLLVSVPAGGVKAGQRFNAIVMQSNASSGGGHTIPAGRWRDGLCDCCKFGCCHAQCCLTYWCLGCALGQILQRLKLDWCGRPTATSGAFKIWMMLVVMYLVVTNVLSFVAQSGQGSVTTNADGTTVTADDESYVVAVQTIYNIFVFAFQIMVLLVLCTLRRHTREKYNIPTENCGGCEDCCCSFWCGCCTLTQIARHTADYERYPAQCCTGTGLRPQDPQVV